MKSWRSYCIDLETLLCCFCWNFSANCLSRSICLAFPESVMDCLQDFIGTGLRFVMLLRIRFRFYWLSCFLLFRNQLERRGTLSQLSNKEKIKGDRSRMIRSPHTPPLAAPLKPLDRIGVAKSRPNLAKFSYDEATLIW